MPTETIKIQTPFTKMKNKLKGLVNPKAEADRLSDEAHFSDEEIAEYEAYHQKENEKRTAARIEEPRKNSVMQKTTVVSDMKTLKSNILPLPTSFAGQEDTSDLEFEKQFFAKQKNSQEVSKSNKTLKTASDLSEI